MLQAANFELKKTIEGFEKEHQDKSTVEVKEELGFRGRKFSRFNFVFRRVFSYNSCSKGIFRRLFLIQNILKSSDNFFVCIDL